MIHNATIQNLANLHEVKLKNLAPINVIIGENDSGKTMILKALYVLSKSVEEFGRGNDNRSIKEIVADKLYWTFQCDQLGDLVSKDQDNHLKLEAEIDDQHMMLSFSKSAKNTVSTVTEHVYHREENSIFFPAKEVLSLFNVIKKSRAIDKEFGFDDTYYDLVLALEKSTQQGKNFRNFTKSKKLLEKLINGNIEYKDGKWLFKKGKMKISIYSTAEGIKKISILDRLLTNRYITPGSIIYIDEPESALHPKAIVEFLDILSLLSKNNIQIFMATHSFFVLKKLLLIARKENMSIPVFSIVKDKVEYSNLNEGMPDNPIVDTSIELYEEELDLDI